MKVKQLSLDFIGILLRAHFNNSEVYPSEADPEGLPCLDSNRLDIGHLLGVVQLELVVYTEPTIMLQLSRV